ncbi:MAG: Gfo/Idh/MocA family oxidoreductase [Terracidiphilus sp.]|jgi:predicted dehydrogenase
MIRVGVIGTGLIGRERLAALSSLGREGKPVSIRGIYDADSVICHQIAAEYGTAAFASTEALLQHDLDWVMIALPHDSAAQVASEALQAGASVLIEKPMGRDLDEAMRLVQTGGERLHVGFNYRFYEGISRAVRDIRSGRFGKVISIEFVLGHGCAPGQEKTWKLDELRAGGGCLIDPGVHLLDLCLQLAPGGVKPVGGTSWAGFWNTGIEEEVSLLLEAGEFSISMRISLVAWRSTFLMRVNGTDGYGIVTGRNRSYGKQQYTFGKRWGWREAESQAASEVIELVDDGLDVFKRETEALLFGSNRAVDWPRIATAQDALAVMKLLDEIRAVLGLRRDYSS